MRLHRAFTVLAALTGLAACEKNAVQDLTGPLADSRIRFHNFAVGAPGVHFFSDGTKLTATTSTSCQSASNPPVTANDSTCLATGRPSTTGITYGNPASGAQYTALAAGQYTFEGRLASDLTTVVSAVPQTLAADEHYSYYLSGRYNTTTKTSDGFIVRDNFPASIDWSVANVRLVNAIFNSQPLILFMTDVESGETIQINGAVPYKSASDFVEVPPGLYDLYARYEGSTTNRLVRTNIGIENGFVYTIGARGDMTVTSTTSASYPVLDFVRNR